ncbi:MAG: hypothetical protein ACREBU_18260 [Nitrososphaera sp.]
MSNPSGSDGDAKKNPLSYVPIIASVAVLAYILSPVSPLIGTINPPTSTDIIPEDAQRVNITDEDLLACTALFQGVEYAIGGGRQQLPAEEGIGIENDTAVSLTPEEKLASDLLVGEFCNRPELVQEMSDAFDPSINLVAYGCDTAAGKIGDATLQDSLRDYEQIYCVSATDTIRFEADVLMESVEIFRAEILPALQSELENQGDSNATSVVERAESILEMSSASANTAKDLLSAGSMYEAARSLDQATTMYTGLLDSREVSAVLGLEG